MGVQEFTEFLDTSRSDVVQEVFSKSLASFVCVPGRGDRCLGHVELPEGKVSWAFLGKETLYSREHGVKRVCFMVRDLDGNRLYFDCDDDFDGAVRALQYLLRCSYEDASIIVRDKARAYDSFELLDVASLKAN